MGAAVFVFVVLEAEAKADGPKEDTGGPNPPPAPTPDREACLASIKGDGGMGGPWANPMGRVGKGGVAVTLKLRGGSSDAVWTGVLPPPVDGAVFRYKAPEGGVPTKNEGLLPNLAPCDVGCEELLY
jgi:hypothetical protein